MPVGMPTPSRRVAAHPGVQFPRDHAQEACRGAGSNPVTHPSETRSHSRVGGEQASYANTRSQQIDVGYGKLLIMTTPKPRKNRDGTTSWRVNFRVGSKSTTETFATYDGATQWIDLAREVGWQAARELRIATAGTDPTIPTLATFFEEHHLAEIATSATPGTVHNYRLEARRTWLPRLGRLPIDAITREHIVDWVGWQRQQETYRSALARRKAADAGEQPPPAKLVSDKTIRNAHGLLSSVMDAASQRYGLANPARGIRLPSDGEREEMQFLTPDEYDRVLANVDEFWQPFVAFLAGTGTRWGEAIAVRAGDFDLAAAQPVVRITRAWKRDARGGSYIGAPKTRRGRRTIALDPTTVALVRHLVDGKHPDDPVFVGRQGGTVKAGNFHPRVWRPALEASRVGKQPRIHDLRHSHASWLISAGVPLMVVQYRLGHESIKTTSDLYGHLMPGAGELASDAMAQVLGGLSSGTVSGEIMPPQ